MSRMTSLNSLPWTSPTGIASHVSRWLKLTSSSTSRSLLDSSLTKDSRAVTCAA
jgi:hypothetical protein